MVDSGDPTAATATYTDVDGNALVLRGSLSARTRARYARVAKGQDLPPGAYARGRLAALHRVPLRAPRRELVDRRHAGADQSERAARSPAFRERSRASLGQECLRRHCAERFPDVWPPPERPARLPRRRAPRKLSAPGAAVRCDVAGGTRVLTLIRLPTETSRQCAARRSSPPSGPPRASPKCCCN